jgi:hypothetical protein
MGREVVTMKHEELRTAKFVLDSLFKKYHTMFDESGKKKSVYSYEELKTMQIRPTQAKADITYIRRLLLEVAKEL